MQCDHFITSGSRYEQFLNIFDFGARGRGREGLCGLPLHVVWAATRFTSLFAKVETGKLVMVHAAKAYVGFRVVDSLILNLNFTPWSLYIQENLMILKFVLLEKKLFLSLPRLERRIIQLVE